MTCPAFAQNSNDRVHVDIPAQSLSSALTQFGRDTGTEIVFTPETVKQKVSTAIKGDFAKEKAIALLLAGTGLTYRVTAQGAIVINGSPLPADKRKEQTSATGAAQVGAWVAQSTPGEQQALPAGDGATDVGQKSKGSAGLDEIVVTGTSIRGVYPASSPLTIYTQQDIQKTGAQTLEQFFDQLPSNVNALRASGISGGGAEANEDGINGIDLRGLGVGTTLVLLNGRPLAPASAGRTPDISLIPLSAVDRVEVLTDGASAIYGSEAVGGVVNFVLRDHFDGAETDGGYGDATRGGFEQSHAAQTFGTNWGSGNALISGQYYGQSKLDATNRDFSAAAGKYTLLPEDQRRSVFFSGKQDLAEAITVNSDVLYSHRSNNIDSVTMIGSSPLEEIVSNESDNLFVNTGLNFKLPRSLNLQVLGTYTRTTLDQTGVNLQPRLAPEQIDEQDVSVDYDFTAKLDGKLVDLPGGTSRFALGTGYTRDEYRYSTLEIGNTTAGANLGRHIEYEFAELFIPVVGQEQNIPALDRVELTLATRYEDYSDFGRHNSPKIGLLWAPIRGLNLRATYAKSFRAPFLTQVDPSNVSWELFPLTFFPAVASHYELPATDNLLAVAGNRTTIGPATAATKTVGFDVTPQPLPGLKVSATYFNIDFRNQIGTPDLRNGALTNPALYPYIFTLNPNISQVSSAIAGGKNFYDGPGINTDDLAAVTAASAVLYDDRYQNLAISELSGLDASFSYTFGMFSAGTELSRLFHYRQQATGVSPLLSILNTVTEPVGVRSRSWFGLSAGSWSGQLGANYTGSYSNPAVSANSAVASWTTFDLSLAYKTPSQTGFAKGWRFAVAVRNLFDRDPPFVAETPAQNSGLVERIGYDPTNASPLGRIVTLDFAKMW